MLGKKNKHGRSLIHGYINIGSSIYPHSPRGEIGATAPPVVKTVW